MRRTLIPSALVLTGLGVAFALFPSATPSAPRPGTPSRPVFATEQARVRVVTLTDALVQPWALAFLPNGDILITERGGRLRLVREGRLASADIRGLPVSN